ncbi:MAG: hypothetical protein AAFX93_05800 [Verrucomicrobiota bacterium]
MILDDIAGRTLAGLGFYFLGVGGIRASLQQIPGMRFREQIGRATANPVLSAIVGFLLGAITQTSLGVAVILAGLISRGMVAVRQALPLIAWSNLGLVTLVFLNFLEVHVFAMFLVGICGICINFRLGGRFQGLFPPLYSLGLILVGLWMLKVALTQLANHDGFDDIIVNLPAPNLLAFAFGALLRIPVQSSSAVAVIGVILNQAGIFTEQQALMVFYGTAVGTAGAAYFLTSHFKGMMRQVTLFEAAINFIAGVILIGLFYLEKVAGFAFYHQNLHAIATDTAGFLAYAFLAQQVLVVIVAYIFLKPIIRFLSSTVPTTVEEDLSHPRFIHDQAVYDIETGLTLARQEIRGVVERMPNYLSGIRDEGREVPTKSLAIWHQSSQVVIKEIEAFLGALSNKRVKSRDASVRLLRTQQQLDHLDTVETALERFVRSQEGLRQLPQFTALSHNLTESLDAILISVIEASAQDPDDLKLIIGITAKPGERADLLRQRFLNDDGNLDHEQRALAINAITRHERVIWSIHEWAQSLLDQMPAKPLNNKS